MTRFTRRTLPVAATLLLLGGTPRSLLAQGQPHDGHANHAEGVGTVVFPNSGAPAAQDAFLRGMALLHSFAYYDAAEAFREAQRLDPAFALAYWGEALTYRHPLWGEEDLGAARATLARLAPTAVARLARAPTARERAYGQAVETLFADSAEGPRVRGFAAAMRRVLAEYPDDPEAVAHTAIALLGTMRWVSAEERQAAALEAGTLAERVFRAHPNHPGAAHYMIHAYDDPARAAHGVEAARAYAQIAPDVEHALHMPSHIFVQIGLWDDVAASNERSWAASRAWVARRGLSTAELDYHSLSWLHYAYLQQGRYREARALADSARAFATAIDLPQAGRADGLFAADAMDFLQAVETGDWAAVSAGPIPDLSGMGELATSARSRNFIAVSSYQRALIAVQGGDTAAAATLAARYRGETGSPRSQARAAVLAALMARTRGQGEDAIALLREAAAYEERISAAGPPDDWPAHEVLGAVLLASGRPQEAAAAYQAALVRRPNRSAALLGLARARAAAGDAAGAAETYGLLLRNWTRADADLPALAEARRAAGGG